MPPGVGVTVGDWTALERGSKAVKLGAIPDTTNRRVTQGKG